VKLGSGYPVSSDKPALSDAIEDNQTSVRALEPEAYYFLVFGRPIPTFSGLSCRKFDDQVAGMLPLTFEHRQLAAASDKLTSERSERADNVLSIFRKHALVVNRLHRYQEGLHLTLLRPVARNED